MYKRYDIHILYTRKYNFISYTCIFIGSVQTVFIVRAIIAKNECKITKFKPV